MRYAFIALAPCGCPWDIPCKHTIIRPFSTNRSTDKHLIPILKFPYMDVKWRVQHGCRLYDGCLRLVSNASCLMVQIRLLPGKRRLSLVLEWPYSDRNAEYQYLNRCGMYYYLLSLPCWSCNSLSGTNRVGTVFLSRPVCSNFREAPSL